MVQHIEDRAVRRERALTIGEADHRNADRDKSDLRDRRAGEGTLQLHREKRKKGSAEHCDRSNYKEQLSPEDIAGEDAHGYDQNTENAGFHYNARQKGARRRRGDGMGQRETARCREQPRLCAEADENTECRCVELGAIFDTRASRAKLCKMQSSHAVVKKQDPEECNRSADGCECEIGFTCLQRSDVFFLGDPRVDREGGHLEEDVCREEIG